MSEIGEYLPLEWGILNNGFVLGSAPDFADYIGSQEPLVDLRLVIGTRRLSLFKKFTNSTLRQINKDFRFPDAYSNQDFNLNQNILDLYFTLVSRKLI